MDAVDRARVVEAIYPTLRQRVEQGWDADSVEHVIAASAEGYPFPVNLDRAQPVSGMAPPTQADLVRNALAEGVSDDELVTRLRAHAETTLTH